LKRSLKLKPAVQSRSETGGLLGAMETSMPSVLIETGFLSNMKEEGIWPATRVRMQLPLVSSGV